jgi:hypothetical protein
MSGRATNRFFNNVFGAGFGVEDGSKLYRLVTLENDAIRTIGLTKDTADPTDIVASYYIPDEDVDWRSLKHIRLTVDRRRVQIRMYVDGELSMTVPMGSTFPPSASSRARVFAGHLVAEDSLGDMNIASLVYLNRYKAWEIEDGLDPVVSLVSTTEPSNAFVLESSGANSSVTVNADSMEIAKGDTDIGTKNFFTKPEDLADTHGVITDFSARVTLCTDKGGQQFPVNCWTGAGVRLFFGNKVLTLGFFDCGVFGRRVAVVPGAGIQEITQLTALGKKFSAPIDWTEMRQYRIQYRAFDSIKIWTGSLVTDPAIVIPWRNDTDGFDLPVDLTPTSLAFGHFDESLSSTTEWEYLRWGQLNGYEISVVQEYPDGLKDYLFDGKAFIITEFSE